MGGKNSPLRPDATTHREETTLFCCEPVGRAPSELLSRLASSGSKSLSGASPWSEGLFEHLHNGTEHGSTKSNPILPNVAEQECGETDVYEMSGGLCDDDEAISVSSDDNTVCSEIDELLYMPTRLVGKRAVVQNFAEPHLAWNLLPDGFHITVKALSDILMKFSDVEEKILSELLLQGGICNEDVAYLESLEPCVQPPAEGKEYSDIPWGSPWVPSSTKTVKLGDALDANDAVEEH